MRSIVHRDHPQSFSRQINFSNGTWSLADPPVRGKRLIKALEDKHSVDAFMADEHDDIFWVPSQNKTEGVRSPQGKILQRLAAWESGKVRRAPPSLPFSVVDIVQLVHDS